MPRVLGARRLWLPRSFFAIQEGDEAGAGSAGPLGLCVAVARAGTQGCVRDGALNRSGWSERGGPGANYSCSALVPSPVCLEGAARYRPLERIKPIATAPLVEWSHQRS